LTNEPRFNPVQIRISLKTKPPMGKILTFVTFPMESSGTCPYTNVYILFIKLILRAETKGNAETQGLFTD
jgi:hypothetical protein